MSPRVRHSAKCTVCGRRARTFEPSGYVCNECRQEQAEIDAVQQVDEDAVSRIRQQTKHALEERRPPRSREKAPAPTIQRVKRKRRSISLRGTTNARLSAYAKMMGKSKQSLLEEMILPIPEELVRPPSAKKSRPRSFSFPLML